MLRIVANQVYATGRLIIGRILLRSLFWQSYLVFSPKVADQSRRFEAGDDFARVSF